MGSFNILDCFTVHNHTFDLHITTSSLTSLLSLCHMNRSLILIIVLLMSMQITRSEVQDERHVHVASLNSQT